MLIKAGHHIGFIISHLRHLFKLLNPDFLVETLHPLCLNQFFLSLPGVYPVFRYNQLPVMKMFPHTAQNSRISRCHCMIHIGLGDFHRHGKKKRQIHGAHGPQEI